MLNVKAVSLSTAPRLPGQGIRQPCSALQPPPSRFDSGFFWRLPTVYEGLRTGFHIAAKTGRAPVNGIRAFEEAVSLAV